MHGVTVMQDRIPQPDAAVAIQNVKPFRLAAQHRTAVPRSIHDVPSHTPTTVISRSD